MDKSLGAAVRESREARGLSLRDVEERTGLSNGYLSLLENGKIKQPKPPVLYTLAEALGVPYPDLMTLAGYTPPMTGRGGGAPRPAVAFKGAERLTEAQRKEVQDFIDFKLRQRARRRGGQE